jgi:HlyD family secretion protein
MKAFTSKITITFVAAAFACGSKDEPTKPQLKPLIEAVYASGFVVSEDEYEIFAQVDGYLAKKIAEEGSVVKKGEPLFVIEAGQQNARYDIAKETFELASKNYKDSSPVLKELAAAKETAHSKLKFDSLNFIRYSNLLKKNATSQSEFDRIKLLYENSQNEFILQKSRYERTKNQLLLDLQNAKNQLAIASDESGRYTVRSEMDGIVYMTAKEEGELVRRNEVLGVVGKKDAYYVELNIDELDIQRVKKGQDVIVKIDAYPKKIFHATISQVYPMVDRRQQSVKAEATFKEQLPGGFSGLALEANIIIRQKDQAIVIPKNKLLPGDSVLIQTDDGSKKVKVVTGIETLDEVEVIEGLDTGKLLVKND